jgi:hypothetical protein
LCHFSIPYHVYYHCRSRSRRNRSRSRIALRLRFRPNDAAPCGSGYATLLQSVGTTKILQIKSFIISCTIRLTSVAEPQHFYAAPDLDKNFDAAPALVPTLLYTKPTCKQAKSARWVWQIFLLISFDLNWYKVNRKVRNINSL